jgi:transposase
LQRRLAKEASPGRVEVLSDTCGRRQWSDEAKGRIVLESHAPGARVVDVARRHRIAPQQVTTWRREARQGKLALPVDDDAGFALLALEEHAAPAPGPAPAPGLAIAIEQDGLTIRLPADTPPERIAAVAAALRRAR